MSLTLKRRELLSARAFFIPAGTVVDAVTVATAAWPDNDPATNYTNFEFEDIESIEEAIEVETESRLLGRPSGGYQNETEHHIRGMSWTATTVKTNSLVKRLHHQLAAAAVASTAQAPGVMAKPQIDGVFLLELRNTDGAIAERTQVWARLTLASPGAIGPQTRQVQVRFERLFSTLNTYVAI